jgi:acyl-CoA synthetase (AMP-forming)/AMP-acid ligase II
MFFFDIFQEISAFSTSMDTCTLREDSKKSSIVAGRSLAPRKLRKHVRACAAFAADHDVLQEMVGIVIVPETGGPRSLDLPTLHAYIAEKLATPKWPQCLIFMDDGLPKSHTNKLLRVKLGSRLGLPEFSDSMSYWERTFEAKVSGGTIYVVVSLGPVV